MLVSGERGKSVVFFFSSRRRHTRWPRDWSSDVCSSDLAYSGISYYMMAIREQAKAQGWVETLLGRKRQIPELRASNPALRGAGERMAINMPIQGTAADIQKIGRAS